MNKESFFISLFNSKHIGDDAATIGKRLYSHDIFCEGIHFQRAWMSLEAIARKAMLVNISDAVAMNAKPRYALVGIEIPKHFGPEQLRAIAKGLQEACNAFGCEIVGGDTVAGERLCFSITIVSSSPRPIGRGPIKEGMLLAYTGRLGGSKKELTRALRYGTVGKKSRFAEPVLRQAFMQRAARHITAAMDISDGLFDDLAKLSRLNSIGFRFLKPIKKEIGCSGEEYELLIAFWPSEREALMRIAQATRTPLTIFARATRGRFRNICHAHHF